MHTKRSQRRYFYKKYKKTWMLLFVVLCAILHYQFLLSVINNLSFQEDFELEHFDNEVDKHSNNLPLDFGKFKTNSAQHAGDKLCDGNSKLIGNVINHTKANVSYAIGWKPIESMNPKVSRGRYSPKTCQPYYKVAIIIPLRNREKQLKVLLSHMHPIWQRQEIDYTVYTITQAGEGLFNRAKLINVGVAEAMKDRQYDCFVFHDVDLLLEDDRCLYWCNEQNPRHVAMYIDKFDYEPLTYVSECRSLLYHFQKIEVFGGISMMTPKQFSDVNGFSNFYWGWGGEDDDMYYRLKSAGYEVSNPYGRHCSFRMIVHEHESSNAKNEGRYVLLYHSTSRMKKEGFNTLRYKLISIERLPLYVNITVDIGGPSMKMIEFMSRKLSWWDKCIVRVPWRT